MSVDADSRVSAAMAADRLAAAWRWARENAARVALELGVNFALPALVFTLARTRLGDVGAMMAASAPPLLWSLAEFGRHRRIDAVSLLALAGIALSLLGFAGGGGVRFLQMREHLVGAVIGCVFLGSAAIGKPLILQLSRARLRRTSREKSEQLEALSGSPIFRRAMMTMTLAWGVGLLAEAAAACALIFALTIPEFLIVNPFLGYGTIGGLTAWTYWYAHRRLAAAHRSLGLPPAG